MEHERWRTDALGGLYSGDGIQILPPVSFSLSTLTSAQNVIISKRRLEENPLGFRRRQCCTAKPTASLCSVNHEQVFFFFFLYSYSKELWDFITYFFSLKMVRCALHAKKKRKGALKRFSFPLPEFSGGFVLTFDLSWQPPQIQEHSLFVLTAFHRPRGRSCDSLTAMVHPSADATWNCRGQWRWASSGREKIQTSRGAGRVKRYLRLHVNTLDLKPTQSHLAFAAFWLPPPPIPPPRAPRPKEKQPSISDPC